MVSDDERQGMRPQPLTPGSPEPRYSHLLEVLDGAASLRMAILQAEEALMEPDITGEDRTLLESVLEASRERFERIAAVLRQPGTDAVEALGEDGHDGGAEWSEHDLAEAGRAARDGSDDAEREAAKAIDRLGRSLQVGSRGAVEEFLVHPSPILRAAATKVLGLHWRLREYTDRILWSLASDNVPDCRRAAALALGSLYEATHSRDIGHELVSVVMKEDEEEDVRWASYYALLDIEGRDRAGRPLPITEFVVPRDVDADLIAEYRAEA